MTVYLPYALPREHVLARGVRDGGDRHAGGVLGEGDGDAGQDGAALVGDLADDGAGIELGRGGGGQDEEHRGKGDAEQAGWHGHSLDDSHNRVTYGCGSIRRGTPRVNGHHPGAVQAPGDGE